MSVNYIKGEYEDDVEVFRCRRLRDITEDHFKMACVAAMTEKQEPRCLLGIPSSNDYTLYSGRGESLVRVRSWSGMLTLHIVSEGGTWIDNSHVDGPGAEEVLDEAWRRFLRAKPYIHGSFSKAFKPAEVDMTEVNNGEWARVTARFFDLMADYFEEVPNDE